MKEKRMDCYPWAAPTEEQKRMFDTLSYEDQLEMVRAAIIEGETAESVIKPLLKSWMM